MTRAGPAAPAAPWYRQRWPWFLIAGPALVVVAGVVTLFIAIASDDGLVADDYYRRGLAVNQALERVARGVALGLAGTIDVAPDGTVVLRIARARDGTALPAALTLRVVHPTRAESDRVAVLARRGDGAYAGRVAPTPAGRWELVVETPDWRLPSVAVTGELRGVPFGARE